MGMCLSLCICLSVSCPLIVMCTGHAKTLGWVAGVLSLVFSKLVSPKSRIGHLTERATQGRASFGAQCLVKCHIDFLMRSIWYSEKKSIDGPDNLDTISQINTNVCHFPLAVGCDSLKSLFCHLHDLHKLVINTKK